MLNKTNTKLFKGKIKFKKIQDVRHYIENYVIGKLLLLNKKDEKVIYICKKM